VSKKFLAFDVETGGIDETKSSLLSAFFVVLDENFNAIEELELNIKNEKNEPYQVTAEALKINGINLVDLHTSNKSVSRGLASVMLNDFLYKHSMENGFSKPLLPLGHNVNFDIKFINQHLMTKEIWDKYVSYKLRDTATLANSLKDKGIIPDSNRARLEDLAKFFNLNVEKSKLHSARMDVIVTVAVYQEMLKK
jgi:DNA polymerase III alpha subunit (gram-positive type)